MPDFTTMVKAMKLTWINRFAYKNNTFTHLVSKITGIESIRNYIKSKPLSYTQLEKYPDFYKQIFQYWFDVYNAEPISPLEILNEPLWYNKYILIDRSTVYIKTMDNKGIKTVSDLIDDEGKFKTR